MKFEIGYKVVTTKVDNNRVNREGVYIIPKNEITLKFLAHEQTLEKKERVPVRNANETSFEIPGSTFFLRMFANKLRELDLKFQILVKIHEEV